MSQGRNAKSARTFFHRSDLGRMAPGIEWHSIRSDVLFGWLPVVKDNGATPWSFRGRAPTFVQPQGAMAGPHKRRPALAGLLRSTGSQWL